MGYNELKLDRRDHKVLRSIFKSDLLLKLPEDHPLRVASTFKEKLKVCYDQVKDANTCLYFTSENAWDDLSFRKWSAKFDPSSAFGDDVNDVQMVTREANHGNDWPPLAGHEWMTEEPYSSLEGERRIKLDLRMQEGNSWMAARAKWWVGLTLAALMKLGLITIQKGIRKPYGYEEKSLVYGHLIQFVEWLNSNETEASVQITEIWFDVETGNCGVSEVQDLEIEDPELERNVDREVGIEDEEYDEPCL
jgi:hypothetical protein